jgi:ABC-type bacteriocin/lantibiotic exporter with double-glycine peptidase domain
MILLPVSHQPQQQQVDCLAACARMVLHYLQVPVDYQQLTRFLYLDTIGTPFRNPQHLESLGLEIRITEGDMLTLRQHLDSGLPVIVAVDTAQLTYWSEASSHAMVIVGLDEEFVYVNDPALADAPQKISLAEFELAWLEKDYLCAVVALV